jgi:hypothetical protein
LIVVRCTLTSLIPTKVTARWGLRPTTNAHASAAVCIGGFGVTAMSRDDCASLDLK